jgi:tetratricopeptide (TPR) repeat protein
MVIRGDRLFVCIIFSLLQPLLSAARVPPSSHKLRSIAGANRFSPLFASSGARMRLSEPAATHSGEDDPQVARLFQQAAEAQSRGDFHGAAASYEEVLKLEPHLAGAWMNLGLMHHLSGQYVEAVEQFRAALREDPALPAANLFLGLDLLKLQQPREALVYLQHAERLNPRDGQAAVGLGQGYAALREFQPANDWYYRAAEMNPKDPEAVYGLGITYLDLQKAAASELGAQGTESLYRKRLLAEYFEQEGRLNDAINLYKQILAAHPKLPGIRSALGFDELRLGQIVPAEAEFRAELASNPGFLLARLGLARTALEPAAPTLQCLQELTHVWKTDGAFFRANFDSFAAEMAPEKASKLEEQIESNAAPGIDPDVRAYISSHLKAIQKEPVHALAADSGGDAAFAEQGTAVQAISAEELYKQGHYSACAQKLKAEGQPRHDLLMLLTQCSYYAGDYRTSFVATGKALGTAPQDFEALYWRAASGSKLAIRTLYSAGLTDPNSYRIHLLLGEAYRMMKRYDASESEYHEALRLKPRDRAVSLGLATLFWQEKQFDKALPALQDALAASPHDPEASYLMGDILVARHEYGEAEPYLTVALGAIGKTVFYAHALRGKIFVLQDQTQKAIREYQLALPGDDDGSFHFQISRLYLKAGNQQAAAAALRDSEAIRRRQDQNLQMAFERSE